MKLAIMQPYFFPYLGYFQLINAVDKFVIYDDVNFIKGGWINRNKILMHGHAQWITLPLHNASPNKKINEIELVGNNQKIIKTIRQCYSKAPEFPRIYPLIEPIILQEETNIAKYLLVLLQKVSGYLTLSKEWIMSSDIDKDNNLRGQEKIMVICEALGATHYINLPGGKELYDKQEFLRRGIQLYFIQPKPVIYHQLAHEFIPNLSIIDVLMFNNQERCSKMIKEYNIL